MRYKGGRLGLKFSNEKLAVRIFNDNVCADLRIQQVMLEAVDKYKYVGVQINNRVKYLTKHEKYVTKGNKNAAFMKNKAL